MSNSLRLSFRYFPELRMQERLDDCFLPGCGDLPLNIEGCERGDLSLAGFGHNFFAEQTLIQICTHYIADDTRSE